VACLGTEQSPGPTQQIGGSAEGFSCSVPADWTSSNDRGAVILHPPGSSARTIAIRAVPVNSPEAAQKVIDATDIVLRGLPSATVSAKREVSASLPATAYRLTFTPPNAKGLYKRTHVVLVGERHVFHVIDTAPSKVAADDATRNQLIASFTEEG
jgi:hypothetical protein